MGWPRVVLGEAAQMASELSDMAGSAIAVVTMEVRQRARSLERVRKRKQPKIQRL